MSHETEKLYRTQEEIYSFQPLCIHYGSLSEKRDAFGPEHLSLPHLLQSQALNDNSTGKEPCNNDDKVEIT
jgi:hypothetical protein